MRYDENIMWRAVNDCNGDYDGKFFHAVKPVGVYCRPDLLNYASTACDGFFKKQKGTTPKEYRAGLSGAEK